MNQVLIVGHAPDRFHVRLTSPPVPQGFIRREMTKGVTRLAKAVERRWRVSERLGLSVRRADEVVSPPIKFDRWYLEQWLASVRAAVGPASDVVLITDDGEVPDGPDRRYRSGRSVTQSIVDELRRRSFETVIRLPLSSVPDPNDLRQLVAKIGETPDGLVFSGYDRRGTFLMDGFSEPFFRLTEGLSWAVTQARRGKPAVEYYHASTIPKTVKCVSYGPDASELEQIVACRHWFNPVLIKNLTTYCSEEYDFLLDPFLLDPEHRFFSGKDVLEVGCWEGALGSQALLAGARSVHFTDSPLSQLDWRFPYPSGTSGSYEQTVGEAIGSLSLVLAHRDSSRTKFSHANVYSLTRELDARYDVTIFGGILYHLFDPMLAIREICAVTREKIVVGTWVMGGREPLAYLQLPLETDGHDTTTWFYMTVPMLRMLFEHEGFVRSAVLGGDVGSLLRADRSRIEYRYIVFGRV